MSKNYLLRVTKPIKNTLGGFVLRIISGKRRGYKLTPPIGDGARPTTDRVKESLFNIIQTRLPCKNVLDLFAGSGALGIEALSRGAERAVFVESDRRTCELIDKNLTGATLSGGAEIKRMQAREYLDICDIKFDIIFLDPPYNKGFLKPAIDKILERDLLADGGIIVIESETKGSELGELLNCFDGKLSALKTAKYGRSSITVLQR